jgi:hypothetical protein
MKLPMGRFGSFRPARFRWMAFTTLATASSCPITLPTISSFMRRSLPLSFSAMRITGMPLIIATTSATFSSVTVVRLLRLSSSHCFLARSSSSSSWRSRSRSLAASS